MKFGYFDDIQKEYCITTPFTPYPWINYLGNDDFYSIISHTAGGYCFYRDALLRRITRYRYNNVPLDNSGRLFYITDGNTTWSPSWKPMQTQLDSYECRHGLGYTKIKGAKNGLKAELLFFVPRDTNCEIHELTLTNEGQEEKSLKLFAMVEFCLWNAQDDMNNFQRNFSTGEVEIEPGVIYHKTEYRERRNHFSFYAVNCKPDGFDSDRESFLGLHNGYDRPQVVLSGKAGNSVADGWSPIAAHYFKISLKPKAKQKLIFILGYVENPDEEKWEKPGVINKTQARKMIARFSQEENVAKAFGELKGWWEKLLNVYSIESGLPELNRMVNIWNQYQCIITFRISRSASYFESGIGRGIGFRDTNQDLLGCMHQIPALARQRILDVAATQLANGGAFHQYQPLTKRGNNAIGSNFNDDPLWLILAVSAYLKETGDWAILDEMVDFENDPMQAAPLFEHLKRAFHYITDRKGPHGLPLIGRADWNDCLNLNCFSKDPTDSFQTVTNKDGKTAESVLIAGMFVFIGREYAEIARRCGLAEEAAFAEAEIAAMVKTVEDKGWDKEWYLRAYDDAGQKVGSSENEDGKILIESQGFCAMAEIGKEKDYPVKALNSVEKHLATEHGIVLVWPAYKKYYLNLGEISSYPPGYKENGGIFCHNNPWIMIAEAIANRPSKAFKYYKLICPAYREGISEVHRLEPYVYSQMIAGKEARRFGEAKNSWLTGTAAWNFVAISQWILGVRPHYDGLLINPKLPADISRLKVKRVFRGVTYEINMIKKQPEVTRVSKAILDGRALSIQPDGSLLIPLAEVTGQKALVEVELE